MSKILSNILFSRSFRRMAGKTQLFSNYNNDHFHTRLSHTIEVENIAERIITATGANCNSNLARIIAVSHDLGHTPFGHAGERALNDITYQIDDLNRILNPLSFDKVLFKHNYYSAKVLLGLEISDSTASDAILAGVILHTGLDYHLYPLSQQEKQKTIAFYLDNYGFKKEVIKKINNGFAEASLVELSDEIAQSVSDLHDILLSKMYIITKKDIDTILPPKYRKEIAGYPNQIRVKSLIKIYTNYLIDGSRFKQKRFVMLKPQQESLDRVKKLSTDIILKSPLIRNFDNKGKYVIKKLFKAYYSNPSLLDDKSTQTVFSNLSKRLSSYSQSFKSKMKKEFLDYCSLDNIEDKISAITEIIKYSSSISALSREDMQFIKDANTIIIFTIVFFIANMTDRYALNKYADLFDI